MKLARKFLVWLIAAALIVLGTATWLAVRDEVSLYEADVHHDHAVLGNALAGAIERGWQAGGENVGRQILRDAGGREHQISMRLVRLDARGEPGEQGLAFEAIARQVSESGRPRFGETTPDRRSLVSYVPLGGPARPFALELVESAVDRSRLVDALVTRFAVIAVALAAAFTLVTLLLGMSLIGRPMRLLVAHARRIGGGDLGSKTELRQRDEIGQLAQELDQMSAHIAEANARAAGEHEKRIATLQQLRHADRLTTVGQLASGLAHELGTPLNVVHGHARLIEQMASAGEDAARSARVIAEQTERMTALIRRLLGFARRGRPEKAVTDLSQLAKRTLALLQPLADSRRVEVKLHASGPAPAEVDASLVQQMLTNLVMNAVHATSALARPVDVDVSVEAVVPPATVGGPRASFVRIDVVDQGEGIPEENLERIFEPFFTTKDVGEGTGLGLSVSYGIARDHGGWIGVQSEPGHGSRFSLFLPATAGA